MKVANSMFRPMVSKPVKKNIEVLAMRRSIRLSNAHGSESRIKRERHSQNAVA